MNKTQIRVLGNILLIMISVVNVQKAQKFSVEERTQGYAIEDSTAYFIFDPEMYDTDPNLVVVTGNFRNWDQDLDNEKWILREENDLFILSLPLANLDISPMDQFKFRIDDGEWMQPPAIAENEKSGNLVFMHNEEILSLKSEILGSKEIWAELKGYQTSKKADYRLTNSEGEEISILAVESKSDSEVVIIPHINLDKRRVYFLEIPSLGLKEHCRFDGWFRHTNSNKELGANIHGDRTDIRIFAPRAEKVVLYLYKKRYDKTPYKVVEMAIDSEGVWELGFEEDLHGYYYDFTVHGASDPGNYFYESHPVHITDPYARVSDNTWGRARIWHKTKAAQPLPLGRPKMQDLIAYEVHIQDFTDLLPIKEEYKGTFKGMTIKGLRNDKGQKIGFDHLLDLGINAVHLMPVQEYLHYPDEDWKASFQDDPYMIEQGISEENYQWGYRTSHFFAIESKYRTKGSEPGKEREEFRDLVQAFHDEGIAVIIDIVPNHTAENMDGNEWFFNFNVLDQQYYYRTKDFKHIGAYGNEVKTENRPMVRRWLMDQCLHFIEEFGIDGFRIDLAGQIDRQSLKALKDALGEDVIVYGEAWIGSNDPEFENNPDWDWYKHNSPITFFQDDSRNAFKGPVFELNNKYRDRGWPGGKYEERDLVMKGLSNKFPDDKTPLSGISYLDIHDNFALADQFASEDFDGRYGVDQELYKIAVSLLYTTLGPIVTHGGSEIMRSKGHAPLREEVRETLAGYKLHMHGKRDTYNHRNANHFLWETVGQRPKHDNSNDYENMYRFWRGMNAFRKSDYGAHFRLDSHPADGYFQWILPVDKSQLGYIVNDSVLVLLNPGPSEALFDHLKLEGRVWKKIANIEMVDHVKGVEDGLGDLRIEESQLVDLRLSPESLGIWVRITDQK